MKMTDPIMAKLMTLLHKRVLERAFPSTGTAKVSSGASASPLSKEYRWYKSGTRMYKTYASKQAAMSRRANTDAGIIGHGRVSAQEKKQLKSIGIRVGSGGKGPRSEGRRLGVRPGLSNQQLSGQTRAHFQAKKINSTSGQLFFSDRGDIGAHLEERNKWIAPTEQEQEELAAALAFMLEVELEKIPKTIFQAEIVLG